MSSHFDRQLAKLVTMHAYCRPHGSKTEQVFCDRYLVEPYGAQRDRHGNYHVTIGNDPIVLWSCHTDTVHTRAGSQRLRLDKRGVLTARRSSCLGADDTAGVFVLTELIARGVAGHYVFHYGEEAGCIGSSQLAIERPKWIESIKYAIAVDRRGTSDVITHQCSARTASDAFALDLAIALNDQGMQYAPCDTGLFTDTESYARIVAECTNLSVGYSGAHGARESLDCFHVLALVDALAAIDVSALTCERDATADDRWYDDYDLYRDDRQFDRFDRWWQDRQLFLDPIWSDVQADLQSRLKTKTVDDDDHDSY